MAFNQSENPYASYGFASQAVAYADVDTRAAFLRRTYLNLGLAVFGFVGCCGFLHLTGFDERMVGFLATMPLANLLYMFGFIIVAYACQSWALRTVSVGQQYAALAVYVLAEAMFFMPFLYFISARVEPIIGPIIGPAAIASLVLFAGLTAIVLITARDFSWLRNFLWVGMIGAFGYVIASWIFGFSLGMAFPAFMVVLSCGYILYYTSKVMKQFPETHAVAAALLLFAALAMLFWYMLQLIMSLQSRR